MIVSYDLIWLICIFIHHARHVLLWGYHATWRPELSILPQRPTDPVEPQWFGADLDSQLGRNPAVFLDQSETWQYVAGRISTKDWEAWNDLGMDCCPWSWCSGYVMIYIYTVYMILYYIIYIILYYIILYYYSILLYIILYYIILYYIILYYIDYIIL